MWLYPWAASPVDAEQSRTAPRGKQPVHPISGPLRFSRAHRACSPRRLHTLASWPAEEMPPREAYKEMTFAHLDIGAAEVTDGGISL
jgi:hypothetical protein